MDQQIKDLQRQLQALSDRVAVLEKYKQDREVQQLTNPIDDTSRINFGMGVAGEDTTVTTAAKSVLVNTNLGQLKVLVG